MAKAKKTTTHKGGHPDAQVVNDTIDDPLADLGIGADDDAGDQNVDGIVGWTPEGAPIIKPAFGKFDDNDDDDEPGPEPEPEPGDDDQTQAAKGDTDEGTPSPLDQAALMGLLPEKFRGEDLTEALKKLSKSFGDIESDHGRQSQEIAEQARILKGLGSQLAPKQPRSALYPHAQVQGQPATAAVPQLTQEEEQKLGAIFQNMDILEDPAAPLKAIYLLAKESAARNQAAQLIQYDAIRTQFDQLNRFRADHDDFDDLQPEMQQIVQLNRHLDNPESVSLVYEKAKQLRQAKQIASTQQTTESVLTNEQFKDFFAKSQADLVKQVQEETAKRVQEELLAKFQKGEAMKGTLDSGSTVTATSKEKLDKGTPHDKKKRMKLKTDHGDFYTDDEELLGIITAEQHDAPDLLNL